MAITIQWQAPTNQNVIEVEIHRSDTRLGTYTLIDTIDATSDTLAKSPSNTWVTTYTDTTGTFTHWYKIRFFDGVALVFSEFSDPFNGRDDSKLCTIEDVKNVIDTTGRFTDDEIFKAISEEDELIYIESGTPIKGVRSIQGYLDNTLQDTYYVGEENIYRIDKVFYGTFQKTEYFRDDGYKSSPRLGMIRFLPVASGGPELTHDSSVEIHYVPKIYNRLCTYRAAKRLLEKVDYLGAGTVSKELEVVSKRLNNVEMVLMHQLGIKLSSDYERYNSTYANNTFTLRQDHGRNRFVSSTSWE
jgi:hypothetical protein